MKQKLALTLFGFVFLLGAATPPVTKMHTPPGLKVLWTVPLHRQSTNYSCGAAALKSALAYYGVEVSEEEVMRAIGSTAVNGSEMEPMVALAKSHGLQATSRAGFTIQEIEKHLANEQIAIVTLQAYREAVEASKPYSEIWDSGHYLVVVAIDATNIYFVDPVISGHRGFMSRTDFLERWHDGSLTLGNMQHPAVLLTGTPQATPWELIP